MLRFFKSGAGALVIHLTGSILAAALLSPWLFRSGKWLAAKAATHDYPGAIEWLAAACGRSDFDRFFNRALILCALLLIPLLIWRLRKIPANESAADLRLQPLRPAARKGLHLAVGIVLAGGLLWALGELLQSAGAFTAKNNRHISQLFSSALMPAFFASVIEEVIFRGLILGLWLRALPVARAILGCSLLFAVLHFLKPPDNWAEPDGGSPLAGFHLLAATTGHWLDPLFFFSEFLALFLIGLILATVRVRTRSLWLPIGLHGGWILAFKGFNLFHGRVPLKNFSPLWVGPDLRSGIWPIVTLLVTAGLLAVFLRRESPAR